MIQRCRVSNNGPGITAGGKGFCSSGGLIGMVGHQYVRKVIVDACNLTPARNRQPMFGVRILLFTGDKVFPAHQQGRSGAIHPVDLIMGLAYQPDQAPGGTLAHFFLMRAGSRNRCTRLLAQHGDGRTNLCGAAGQNLFSCNPQRPASQISN